MIVRLAHVCFFTDHSEAMVRFYGEALGLSLQFRFFTGSGRVFGYYFALGGGSFLEIFDQAGAVEKWGGQFRALAQPDGSPFRHFCLEVREIEKEAERLRGLGVEVTPVAVGEDHSKQAWIKDPDGNSIELMEYTADSLQLKGGSLSG